MNRSLFGSRLPQWLTAFAIFVASAPTVAHACPMCFAGGEQNQDAFLFGSIFLMVVPVLSLGSLGFWAYRRIKAIDAGIMRPECPDMAADSPDAPQNSSGSGVVLHMAPRR